MAFSTHDIFVKRRTWEEPDGTAYQRVYEMGRGGTPPSEGDMMPGESSALLGPFIERGGISFGKQLGGGKQEVILKCKKLAVKSGESGAYQELTGRRIVKTPSTVVYTTYGIAATEDEATAPVQGDSLSGTGIRVDPICRPIEIDSTKYPQRFLFINAWESGITRLEFLAL